MPTKKPIVPLVIDDALLQEVENFRFENRFPSRSAALIYLIRKGLQDVQKTESEKR